MMVVEASWREFRCWRLQSLNWNDHMQQFELSFWVVNFNIVASIVEIESFPLGDLASLDFNHTDLFGNHTDLDTLKCHYDHFESLVMSQRHNLTSTGTSSPTSPFLLILQTNFSGCFPTHDKILCWPPTKFNSLATQPCFNEWNGVQYSTEGELKINIRFNVVLYRLLLLIWKEKPTEGKMSLVGLSHELFYCILFIFKTCSVVRFIIALSLPAGAKWAFNNLFTWSFFV